MTQLRGVLFNYSKPISFLNISAAGRHRHTNKTKMRKMNVIRSHQHQIFSETVNKIALSADDDKRIILDDKISTLAFGHKIMI